MAIANMDNEFILKISKTLNSSIDQVYLAWTDADRVSRWFVPSDDHKAIVTEWDVRVGGCYRLEMHAPDGDVHIVSGEYVEVFEPDRLVFTWSWAHESDGSPMLVTIDLIDQGGQTEMTLLHEKLPSSESRDLHEEGWTACLGRLLSFVDGENNHE